MMKIFILHFDCQPSGKIIAGAHWNADLCCSGNTIEEAEMQAREFITTNGYTAGELISFLEVDQARISKLSPEEAMLYLKAQKHAPPCAVSFSA
jgi:hypothetical protein